MATSVGRALQSRPGLPACAGRRLTRERRGRSEPAPAPTVLAALTPFTPQALSCVRSHTAPGRSWTCPGCCPDLVTQRLPERCVRGYAKQNEDSPLGGSWWSLFTEKEKELLQPQAWMLTKRGHETTEIR